MRTYTTTLNKRDPDRLQLTDEEAEDLETAGFRFSIFNPESREYRLSPPYKILYAIDRGTVTLMQ